MCHGPFSLLNIPHRGLQIAGWSRDGGVTLKGFPGIHEAVPRRAAIPVPRIESEHMQPEWTGKAAIVLS
jgi:hypothetical protein